VTNAPGLWGPRSATLVITLLEADLSPAKALAELDGLRWHVATNLRHLKQTTGLDVRTVSVWLASCRS
jgi:hypothetical protein